MRNPKDTMTDFSEAGNGRFDLHSLLWEVIEDILDTTRLVMKDVVDSERAEEILNEIKGYAINHYDEGA